MSRTICTSSGSALNHIMRNSWISDYEEQIYGSQQEKKKKVLIINLFMGK